MLLPVPLSSPQAKVPQNESHDHHCPEDGEGKWKCTSLHTPSFSSSCLLTSSPHTCCVSLTKTRVCVMCSI